MRTLSWIGVVVAGAVGLSSASPASAGPLGFTGSLGLVIANLPPITVTGAGTAFVNGAGGAFESLDLTGGEFATVASIPVDDPGAFPIAGVIGDAANGAGHFAGSPLGGKMPVLGSATLCLFHACDADPVANVVIPFTEGGTSGVGLGGQIVASGFVNLTVTFAPWTTGQATVGGASIEGYLRGPGGQPATEVLPGGSAQLVTPIAIQTSIGEDVPAFGILTLEFVPEPGTLVLFGAGTAGLAAAGRRRMRAGRA